jgi:hypothetical protein
MRNQIPEADNVSSTAPHLPGGKREKLLAYTRLEDAVCKEFLKLGTRREDFEAARLIFPYVRATSVGQTPREWEHLVDYLYFGFFAGHALGWRHPELVEAVLPGDEVRQAMRRLDLLVKHSGKDWLDRRGLERALEAIVESNRGDMTDENINNTVCSFLLKTAKAGFASTTVARTDPVAAEKLAEITDKKVNFQGLFEQSVISAPWRVLRTGLEFALEHPLFQIARELYPDNSLECRTVLEYLVHQLNQFGVKDQSECPAGDLDLLDWISGGLEYGRRINAEQPDLVWDIFKECNGRRLEASIKVVNEAVGKAGKVETIRLIRPLLEWYKSVHYEGEPTFYGHQLARVACIADFAVWIPWITERNKARQDAPRP